MSFYMDFLVRDYMSLVVRKPVFVISDQVRHKPGLYSHRRWLQAWNFAFRKKRECTIQVAKTKALISFAVSAKLICVLVFAYAKNPVFSRRGSYLVSSYIRFIKRPKMNYYSPYYYSPINIFLRVGGEIPWGLDSKNFQAMGIRKNN